VADHVEAVIADGELPLERRLSQRPLELRLGRRAEHESGMDPQPAAADEVVMVWTEQFLAQLVPVRHLSLAVRG
jgi:hypothetical protein